MEGPDVKCKALMSLKIRGLRHRQKANVKGNHMRKVAGQI